MADDKTVTAAAVSCTGYDWQFISPSKASDVLEQRRQELLQILPQSPATDEQKYLIKEWISLVKERDRILQEKFGKENKQKMNEEMLNLQQILKKLQELDHRQTRQSLRQALHVLQKQVEEYCEEQKLTLEENKYSVTAPPPPPPPPPPPSLPLQKNVSRKVTFEEESLPLTTTSTSQSDNDKQATGVKKQTSFMDPDLEKDIKSGRMKLRSTPCKRSPGGTPARGKRPLSLVNKDDLLAYALQKKFRHVKPNQSPKEGETSEREDSFTISID